VGEFAGNRKHKWDPGNTEKLNVERQTYLHILCQQRFAMLASVRKVLEANPSAAAIRDVYGRTPLFYALKRGCCPEIVQLLFESYPVAITERDFCGETPLFLVYHKSKDPRILKAILAFQPFLAMHRVHSFAGPELMQVICSPWERLAATSAATVRGHEALGDQWEKVVLTCVAAHKCRHGASKNGNNTKELHVALELPCSPKVLCWFIKMYPEQAHIPLDNGMLPLHKYVSTRELLNQPGAADVIVALVTSNPAATSTMYKGNMPLHLAIEAGCRWEKGLRELLYSGPEALELPERSSNLLPFMMAATSSSNFDLCTVYMLLREGPMQIQ